MLDFVIVYLLLLAACLTLLYLGNWRIISPPGCVGFTVIIFYGFKLAWNAILGISPAFELKWSDLAFSFSLLTLTLSLVIFASFGSQRRIRRFYAVPHHGGFQKGPIHVNFIFWILFLTGPNLALILGKMKLGMWAWEAPVAFRGFIQSAGMMYIYVAVVFVIQMAVIITVKSVFINKQRPPLLCFLGMPMAIVYSINTGFTSTIINIFVPALYFLAFRKGWRFEIFIPIAIPLAGFFALTHLIYKRSVQDTNAPSFSQVVSDVIDDPEMSMGFMNRLDYPEQFTLAVQHSLLDTGPDYGMNLIGALTQPIPRAIWPEKPLTFSAYMSRELHPENYYAGISANYGGLAEALNAFGWGGIFLMAGLLSVYLYYGGPLFLKACGSDLYAITYIFVYIPLLMGSISGAIANDLALFNVLLNIAFIKLLTMSFWNKRKIRSIRKGAKLILSPAV